MLAPLEEHETLSKTPYLAQGGNRVGIVELGTTAYDNSGIVATLIRGSHE